MYQNPEHQKLLLISNGVCPKRVILFRPGPDLSALAQNTKIKNQKWNHSLRITKTDSHFRDSARVIPFLIFDFFILGVLTRTSPLEFVVEVVILLIFPEYVSLATTIKQDDLKYI
jgi:uncharacterized membrane protein YraQ (UPF0718 family)